MDIILNRDDDDEDDDLVFFYAFDDFDTMSEEFKMATEQLSICSLDLLLDVLEKRCQTPGCSNTPNVTLYLVGTTLVANISCQCGHKFGTLLDTVGLMK